MVRRGTEELAKMRRAGRVVAEMHARVREALRPGVTTARLDGIAREVLDRRGARSNFLGYHGFPAVICASPNDVVVHGIPGPTCLEEGDIVAIDCGAEVDGYHADAAFTAGIGPVSPEASRLIEVVEQCLDAAVARMVDGNRIGDIGDAVERIATRAGFSIVEDYVGHAIGTSMHEKPDVPNHGPPGKGPRLRPGNVLAVEPMLTAGGPETLVRGDGWTVVTADGSLSAHVEHTIAVTDSGPQILTVE